jgi:transmembrane sensor
LVLLVITCTLLININNPLIGQTYIETKTPNAIRSSVKLADGSIVYLNSASKLNYPVTFTGKNREIELSGEAYFEVTHIQDRPFIVKAGSMQIKVLGTHFNVKAYKNENTITTTLIEGKVELKAKNEKPCILTPNQQAIFNKNTNELAVNNVEANNYAIWRNDELFFERETFTEIAQKLERKFSVNIQIKSSALQNEQFSGHFKRAQSVIEVLDKMKLHRNFQYQTYRDTIRITKL